MHYQGIVSERRIEEMCSPKRQHGSFGGPSLTSDAYYAAGSDDFRGYVWKIPETPVLLGQRKEISADRWSLEGDEIIGMLRKVLDVGLESDACIILSVCEICARNTLSACFSFTTVVPFER